MKNVAGKLSFGFLFVIVVPAILIFWAVITDSQISLPVPKNCIIENLLIYTGGFLVGDGMLQLWLVGKGLPMSAFPPRNFVKSGIYAIMRHPIYAGVVLNSFGFSMAANSASGFWLVSPIFVLMIVAYTVGYENEKTEALFGTISYKPFLSLAEPLDIPAKFSDKLVVYILAYLPWLIIYETFIFIGVPIDAIVTNFNFEKPWPVIEWTALFYIVSYLYAFSIPIIIKSKKILRQLTLDVWLVTLISGILYFTFPFVVEQRTIDATSLFGRILQWDRSLDGVAASFPAFHVIWVMIAGYYYTICFPKYKFLWYGLSLFMSASCITTGSHSLVDVISALVIFGIVIYKESIWNFIRTKSESIANSWIEWRFGPIRLINHGFYTGASGFFGILIASLFIDEKNLFSCLVIGIFCIAGAGLWAQWIEGSSKLLRPYGYYGGMLGILAGAYIISVFNDIEYFQLVGAFAMAAPCIQFFGRFRCLVQGCCHGKPCNNLTGIRFTNPHSRVTKISGLQGLWLHPTQIYSMATNLLTSFVLFRLYSLEMTDSFIIGIYFILNGLGRFVEEAYRGEVQTPYWAGMRLYQWLAICTILLGIAISIFSGKPLQLNYNAQSFYWAIGVGILCTVAYGLDFPDSNKRFARLTSNE